MGNRGMKILIEEKTGKCPPSLEGRRLILESNNLYKPAMDSCSFRDVKSRNDDEKSWWRKKGECPFN